MLNDVSIKSKSTPKRVWSNIVFFAVTSVLGFIVAPWYFFRYGISSLEMGLCLFYILATGFAITVGYHRLYAHRNFLASPLIHFLALFFGAAAFEQSAFYWASLHRDHHRYVDTDDDPYSIKKGFFYAHIGWLLFWKHRVDGDNAKDLQQNALLMNQDKYYFVWSIFSGMVLPMAIGALTGHFWGVFLFAVCFRLAFVHHSTFFINSVCHTFGKATYDVDASARDHWLVALLTNGEGYHNFHHRFPGDYRNGIRWYQWDPSKWVIALCAKLGLAWDLRRVSHFSILQAKLAAEHTIAHKRIVDHKILHELEKWRDAIGVQYEKLTQSFSHWEATSKKHQAVLLAKATTESARLKVLALEEMRQARERFQKAYEEWTFFLNSRLPNPQPALF
jgi:stearoyl-CoA desaturase (delta-9 desaturase)